MVTKAGVTICFTALHHNLTSYERLLRHILSKTAKFMTQQSDWFIQPTRLQPNRLFILSALFRQPIIVDIKCIFRHFIKFTVKSSKLTHM